MPASAPRNRLTDPGPASLRAVWVALILLAGAFVGAGAGSFAYLGGAGGPDALLAAGGVAGSAVALMLGLLRYLDRP
jgi:hypothetical protein